MLITDYNNMSVEKLQIINKNLGIEFQINDGKIVNAEKMKKISPAADQSKTGLIKNTTP